MDVFEEVKVPEHIIKKHVKTLCDMCKRNINEVTKSHDSAWFNSEVTVSLREGITYPEGGSGIRIDVDLCRECFLNRLVLWLRSQEVKVEVKDWDT